MAISNAETVTSKTDYDTRAHRSNSKDRNSKTHNSHAKGEQPVGGNHRKEDSVTISEDGKILSQRDELRMYRLRDGEALSWAEQYAALRARKEERMNQVDNSQNIEEPEPVDWTKDEYEKNGYRRGKAEESIFSFLDGKVKNAGEVAKQLGIMLFTQDTVGWAQQGNSKIFSQQYTNYTDLETRAANREAARELAKHIAENYMGSPEEAQAFIDKINDCIEASEKLDKGYVESFEDWETSRGLKLPDPMSDDDKWLLANFDKYFGHLDVSVRVFQNGSITFDMTKSGSRLIQEDGSFSFYRSEVGEAFRAASEDLAAERMAYHKKNPAPYKFWPDGSGGPTWEERKEMDCDSRFSQYSEQNKAWYKEFLAKSNLIQNLINNAKLITDFSGNEKWNIVMNLLA